MADPETEFLVSKRSTGNDWEMFKENVRPLKRGRNIGLLNSALNAHNHNHLKKSLLDHRRRLIEAIDEYQGDDPLLPWLECIKWVQESFPAGGDCSGLVVIYEKCVRTFWHSERYKDDLRYLKVWLEYADHCIDADVIYSFLESNGIGRTHSTFYISYASYMESRNKIKAANEIFDLGISRNAQPEDKLKDAYRKFLARSIRGRPKEVTQEEDLTLRRSFGTVLAVDGGGNRVLPTKNLKPKRTGAVALTIYEDSTAIDDTGRQEPKRELESVQMLGARPERNKENCAIPGKWTTYKIPQIRTGGATASTACIPVFVDEDCKETQGGNSNSSSLLNNRRTTRQEEAEQDLKRETELLRKKPLRNFPPHSLPR